MSKRLASDTGSSKRRKRNRNGISVTREVLDFAGPPETTPHMCVWHANAKEPTVTQKSSAPIPDSQDSPPVERVVQFEEMLDVGCVPRSVTLRRKQKCPKRKRRNDSVSPFLFSDIHLFLSFVTAPSRREWRTGSTAGRLYWKNSSAATAFNIMTAFRHALIASRILAPSSAATVLK